jgi:hypothetical protein
MPVVSTADFNESWSAVAALIMPGNGPIQTQFIKEKKSGMEQPLQQRIEKLLTELDSPDANVRRAAAEGLEHEGVNEERVLSALNMSTVTDTEKAVRRAAADAYLSLAAKPRQLPAPEPSADTAGGQPSADSLIANQIKLLRGTLVQSQGQQTQLLRDVAGRVGWLIIVVIVLIMVVAGAAYNIWSLMERMRVY